MYCGPTPSYIIAMHAIRMANIGKLVYGADVVIDNYKADHSTYAIAGRNNNASGGGIFGYSPNIGVLGFGAGGAQCQSLGTGSGYGVFGTSASPADNGQFKYGIAGTDGGHTVNYAGYFNGMSYFSQTPVFGSDARWKTEIRSESEALTLINKLRPSSYRYIQDSHYSFPAGVHHGFIAQELETVFPELVTDVTHPTTFDPETMTTNGTEVYKGIRYDGLISILTAGIQELDSKVVAQQAEIESLKEMVKTLTDQMAELKK
jgi:hypothetical protein